MINIEDSFQLYLLINRFFPEDIENYDLLSLSSTIIDRIIEANEHEKFVEISMLLTKKTLEELTSMDMQDFLLEFMQSLVENHVLDLIDFYEVGIYA